MSASPAHPDRREHERGRARVRLDAFQYGMRAQRNGANELTAPFRTPDLADAWRAGWRAAFKLRKRAV